MENNLFTKSKIADILGTNPMRVARYIERKKLTPVKKIKKRELYNLTDFNVLKEELEAEEPTHKATSSHSGSKDKNLTLKQQLETQKHYYESLLAAKEETIASLKETIKTSDKAYEDMKEQLAVKDGQIASLTKLTTNAQTLNLLDKPKQDKEDKSNSETNVKNENATKEEPERKGWFKKHFGK